MKFTLSRHAKEEMQRRAIPGKLLDDVLEHPQQVVPEYGGKRTYQSQVDFGGGEVYLLRAIVSVEGDRATVVTVYRTRKIKKYWRGS